MPDQFDAIVVGAGPNGLAAAVELARNGRSVLVLEAAGTIGGGARSEELTEPDFVHDVCSAIHPMGAASPFFATLPLADHGLEWIHPDVPLAHPLDDGTAVLVHRSVDETAAGLGPDATTYRRIFGPLVRKAPKLMAQILGPPWPPRHPIAFAGFGLRYAARSADKLVGGRFSGERARAVLGGNAVHALLPLNRAGTGGFALIYNILAHAYGWPIAKGGSQSIVDALGSYLRSMGGEIRCGEPVEQLSQLPPSKAVLFDLAPKGILSIAGDALPSRYRAALQRYRYGPGVFKIDWALDGPVPWKASEAAAAGCLHLVGTYEEAARSEATNAAGEHAERPWVIIGQQSLFDTTRAPAGKHTLWGYCHVPHGSDVDMTARVEAQVERFAPGFRDLIRARSVKTAIDLERYNANYVGGDIASGAADVRQIFLRPVARLNPYRTPNDRLFICSSATPPGPAVHGMCGYFAARSALRSLARTG